MADDIQAVESLISRYHQALMDKDLETALACTVGSQLWFAGNESDDPTHWAAVGYANEEELRRFLRGITEYTNQIKFLQTSVSRNAGLVVVRETGSFKSSENETTWEDCSTVCFTVKVEEEWKIVALFNRDLKVCETS